jgi:hypothetical protein
MEDDEYYSGANPNGTQAYGGFWDLAWRILDCVDNWNREELEETLWVTVNRGVLDCEVRHVVRDFRLRHQPDYGEVFSKWVRHPRWIVRALSAAINQMVENGKFGIEKEDTIHMQENAFAEWMRGYSKLDTFEHSSPCTACGRYVSLDITEKCPWCDQSGRPHEV